MPATDVPEMDVPMTSVPMTKGTTMTKTTTSAAARPFASVRCTRIPLPPHGGVVPGQRSGISALLRDESGAATAEYAIATMAAVAFAGMLVIIMRSDEVRGMLTELVHRALSVP